MAYMYYDYSILIGDDSDFSLDQFEHRFRLKFPNVQTVIEVAADSNTLVLAFSASYRFTMMLNEEAHVIEESAQLANSATAHKNEIARCRKRLELSGEADPGMDHFNDSLFILETLETFTGMHVYSPMIGFIRN